MKILHREFFPTTTPSVHASTICFWKDHMVSAWFGGTREGNPDTAIYLHNLNNDGEVITIGTKDSIPRWNPILVPIGKKLYLFTKAGIFCDRWQSFIHDITDWTNDIPEKEIFATARVLPAGLNGPVKSKPLIVGQEGTPRVMYCGSSVETIFDWTSYVEEYTVRKDDTFYFFDRSGPLNVEKKVNYTNPVNGRSERSLGIIQPTLWNDNGNIRMFFRSSRGLEKIYYSENWLGTWLVPKPTNLPNPNSAVDVVCMNDRLFLVHNPSNLHRYPLVVSEIKMTHNDHSYKDEGSVDLETIDEIEVTKEIPENISCNSYELSYPYMVGQDGKLHLSYTYGRSKIEYITIEV